MNGFENATDAAILAELGHRLARHRLERNLTQARLAREAGVSKRTLLRLESGQSSQSTNLIRVLRALGLLGDFDAFVPRPLVSPIALLRSKKQERRRASPARKPRPRPGGWTWGEDAPRRGGEP